MLFGGGSVTAERNIGSLEQSRNTRGRGSTRIAVLLILAAVVIAALWFLPLRSYVIAVLSWTEGLGAWGPVALAVFYVVACVFFLPGSVLTLGAGFLFPFWIGLLAAWVGANLGAAAAFLIGRTVARDWVARKVETSPKFAAIDEAVGKEGFKIVFLLRLSPAFPFNLLNYALGLTKVSFGAYAGASLIGMLPGAMMYVYLGSAARSLADVAAGQVESGAAGRVFFWVGLAATIAVVVLVTRIAAKSLASAEAGLKAQSTANPAPATSEPIELIPDDAHNRSLAANVRPSGWVNPKPADRYNLVVIGAGTAGLVTAAAAATLGAKVALVERNLLGGDCLNYGCVPSKSLIRSSRVAAEASKASDYGIQVNEPVVDFPAVMERVRRIRARISDHDSADRFTSLGADVFLGHGCFAGPDNIEVDGKTLRFKKAVIATGTRPVVPNTPGLRNARHYTNETIFSLTELPRRLAVIGGGPIGCELAQAFRRLGSDVVLLHKNAHILDREDADAAEIVQQRFLKEGIRLILNSSLLEVTSSAGGTLVNFEVGGVRDAVEVDAILVAVGRAANVDDMGLNAAGVQFDARSGIIVSDTLWTSNPRIYAAGDVCMKYKFTHAADAAARIVIQNALFKGSRKVSSLTMPWCTYTDPEVAHVGLYERDAAAQGIAVDTFVRHMTDVDRAVADSEEEGFVKVHVKKGSDRIVGATIVSAHAGEMIGELVLAITTGTGLNKLSGVIHPYPTQAEAIRHAADAYRRTRLTPAVAKVLGKWLDWTR